MSSLVKSVNRDLYGCKKPRPSILEGVKFLSERYPCGTMTTNVEDRPEWKFNFSVGGSRGSNATQTSKKSGSESTEPLKSTSKPDVVFQPAILESEPKGHHHRSTPATSTSLKQGKRRWNQATSSSANVFLLRTMRQHQDAEKIFILHGALHEARENKDSEMTKKIQAMIWLIEDRMYGVRPQVPYEHIRRIRADIRDFFQTMERDTCKKLCGVEGPRLDISDNGHHIVEDREIGTLQELDRSEDEERRGEDDTPARLLSWGSEVSLYHAELFG